MSVCLLQNNIASLFSLCGCREIHSFTCGKESVRSKGGLPVFPSTTICAYCLPSDVIVGTTSRVRNRSSSCGLAAISRVPTIFQKKQIIFLRPHVRRLVDRDFFSRNPCNILDNFRLKLFKPVLRWYRSEI